MEANGSSTNFLGGVGLMMILSGILGIRRNWWGLLCQTYVLVFAYLPIIFLYDYFTGYTPDTSFSGIPYVISIPYFIWALGEWIYLVCRMIELTKIKSE